ncbi:MULTISPECIES: EpsG family protein [unclassified Exiguobacterium]|uniref:EpsG family protein n=1 Tax=unclassified Exiguobacterium TaxID=2644629 RepID=UPI001BEAEA48|nr:MULTISPECIES: EpsG family protein [unclassified Exiguobacterium]
MNAYTIYISTVLLVTVSAILAQRYSTINNKGRKVPNKFFWTFSMAILIFVLGFRKYTVGVDGENYISGYNIANIMSLKEYYSINTTEPGFYFLYRFVYLVFDDYQWLFIISAVITVSFFYKAFSYENNNVSLGLMVFIFTTTQYFYYFGIMRMGIAVSIVAVAYRYIIQGNRKKYILMILLATMFHYSALFALIALFIKKREGTNDFKKNTVIKLFFLIPLGFYAVRLFVYPLISGSRYQEYIDSTVVFEIASLLSTAPLLLIFSIYYKKLTIKNRSYQFYYFLFLIKFITEVFAPIIGIGRMVWYANISLCFLFPAVIKLEKNKFIKFNLFIIVVFYCLFYSYNAYFGDSWRGQHMIPYEFFWTE